MKKIPEIDVLIAMTLWLKDRGVIPAHISVASGRGIDKKADTARLREVLSVAEWEQISTAKAGPDWIGVSKTELWQIECKGVAESDKPQTHRNQFDRTLASTVSYFSTDFADLKGIEVNSLISILQVMEEEELQFRLGLAIPAIPDYLNQLRRRVRKSLRKRLDLWIFLLDPLDKSIHAVPPDEEL